MFYPAWTFSFVTDSIIFVPRSYIVSISVVFKVSLPTFAPYKTVFEKTDLSNAHLIKQRYFQKHKQRFEESGSVLFKVSIKHNYLLANLL